MFWWKVVAREGEILNFLSSLFQRSALNNDKWFDATEKKIFFPFLSLPDLNVILNAVKGEGSGGGGGVKQQQQQTHT